jgi:hypothetical protein
MTDSKEPVDLLAGKGGKMHALLAELSDDELQQQIEYYRAKRRDSNQSRYHATVHLSAACAERDRRLAE